MLKKVKLNGTVDQASYVSNLPTTFEWDSEVPPIMVLTFHESTGDVDWVVSRDLINQGIYGNLERSAGMGIFVAPITPITPYTFRIELWGANRSIEDDPELKGIYVDTRQDLKKLLAASYKEVPREGEEDFLSMDLEAALTDILGDDHHG